MKRASLYASLFVLLLLPAAPFGCGEAGEEDNHDHGDDEEHVCVHFESGPELDVNGVEARDGDLPETFEEHTRVDVMMPAAADTAYVKWTSDEAGDFVFWLSKDVPLALFDGDTEVAAEESGGAAKGCEDKAVAHRKFEVEAKEYTVRIGPAIAGETVQFAAEHAEHDGHSE